MHRTGRTSGADTAATASPGGTQCRSGVCLRFTRPAESLHWPTGRERLLAGGGLFLRASLCSRSCELTYSRINRFAVLRPAGLSRCDASAKVRMQTPVGNWAARGIDRWVLEHVFDWMAANLRLSIASVAAVISARSSLAPTAAARRSGAARSLAHWLVFGITGLPPSLAGVAG